MRPINEKLHWSVIERLNKLAIVDDTKHRIYAPRNLPKAATAVVEHTKREDRFIDLCRNNPKNERVQKCALFCDLPEKKRRARRLSRLRDIWEVPSQKV